MSSCLSLLFRSECALLPLPCFHHFPQLAAGKAANVLAGPKPALCQERGGYNGEWCRLTHTHTNTEREREWLICMHQLCSTTEGLSIIVMRLSALLSAGVCCELPCHHLGENPEPFWHLCVQPFLGLGYESPAHSKLWPLLDHQYYLGTHWGKEARSRWGYRKSSQLFK